MRGSCVRVPSFPSSEERERESSPDQRDIQGRRSIESQSMQGVQSDMHDIVYGQESRERKRVSRAYRKGETMLGYMDPSPSIRAN